MKKIIDYKLLGNEREEMDELEDEIKRLITEGWQPWGGLKLETIQRPDGNDVWFWQVMVKYES